MWLVRIAERDGSDGRSSERILAEAGLTDQHIVMLTGRDRARLGRPAVTAFGHSTIVDASASTR